MEENSEATDDLGLADFFEYPSQPVDPEISLSKNASQKKMKEDTVIETTLEIYDGSKSDYSELSETAHNSKHPPVSSDIRDVTTKARPNSAGIEGSKRHLTKRVTASAPPFSGMTGATSYNRPPTSRIDLDQLTSHDFQNTRNKNLPDLARKNVRCRSAPNPRRWEAEYPRTFPQATPVDRPSTSGPDQYNSNSSREDTVVDICNITPGAQVPPQSRIVSAKLVIRNRLANLLKEEMTMRGMKDDVRRNLFAPSLQILEATLFLGSLVFMVPFTVQIRSGEYALEGGILRATIIATLLLSSILLRATFAYESIMTTTVQFVFSVTNTVDQITTVISLLIFGYSIMYCRPRYNGLFETFGVKFFRDSVQMKDQRRKIVLFTLLPFLLCIFLGTWMAWGKNALEYGIENAIGVYRNPKIGIFLFQNIPIESRSLQNVITGIHMFLDTYAYCVAMYTELLLWAASLSVYWMEKKKRAYCSQERVEFDLAEGTSVFRDVHEVVNRRLSRPLGPLLAVSCVSLVTYNVFGLAVLCFGDWSWLILIVMGIKAGHVLIAAEAAANDENLLHHILTKRIRPESETRVSEDGEAANLRSHLAFESQLREFKDAAREPMALKALDFADINYALFGWVLVSAIGYFLVVAEWFKEETKDTKT